MAQAQARGSLGVLHALRGRGVRDASNWLDALPHDGIKTAAAGGRHSKEQTAPAGPYHSGNENTARAGEGASSRRGKEGSAPAGRAAPYRSGNQERAGGTASSRRGKEGAARAGRAGPCRSDTVKRVPADRAASRQHDGISRKEITGRITRCTNVRELVALVEQHGHSFDFIHVTVVLHKAASLSQREKVQPEVITCLVEMARRHMQQMDPQGLANMARAFAELRHVGAAIVDDLLQAAKPKLVSFTPQGLAMIVVALATLRHAGDAVFMDVLVEVATLQLGSFNPQDVANMAWALATLGHEDTVFTGMLLQAAMLQLGSFNSQDLANTAWALAALDDQNAARVLGVDALIERITASAADFTPDECRQLFQFSLWLKTWQPSSTLPPRLLADKRAWLGEVSKTTESRTQEQVLRVIRQLPGCSGAISEHKTDDGLFNINIAVTLPGGQKLAVEVDGPTHFLSNGQPDGATILRNRLLEAGGWRVVSVPVMEGRKHCAKGEQATRDYLAGKLGQ